MKTIIQKVKTYDGACRLLKINPKNLPVVSNLPNRHQQQIIANYKLSIIAQALNEGWTPDWTNIDEYKYYNWFNHSASGFSFATTGYDFAIATVGSRFCFKSKELAEYFGKKFIELHKEHLQ